MRRALDTEQRENTMRKHNDATDRSRVIETTLWELTHTIREVSSSDEEAFAVLEWMIAQGRISVGGIGHLPTAA